MKKILAIGLFVTGFAMSSRAQDTTTVHKQETRKEERQKMMADLNLTTDQQKQMKDVNKDFRDKSKAIKDNTSLSKKDKRDQFMALAKERNDKLSAFLTPDQQAKLKDERKGGRKKKA